MQTATSTFCAVAIRRCLTAWKLNLQNGQITPMRSTNKMALYLKASDVFISKPGGLSSTESAAAGVPLVHISPIPGAKAATRSFCQGGYRRKGGKHRNRAFVGGGKAFGAGKCGRNAQTAESSYQSECSHGYLRAVGNGSTVLTWSKRIKLLIDLFSKGRGFLGQRPKSPFANGEIFLPNSKLEGRFERPGDVQTVGNPVAWVP